MCWYRRNASKTEAWRDVDAQPEDSAQNQKSQLCPSMFYLCLSSTMRAVCEGTFSECMHLLHQVFIESHGGPAIRSWASKVHCKVSFGTELFLSPNRARPNAVSFLESKDSINKNEKQKQEMPLSFGDQLRALPLQALFLCTGQCPLCVNGSNMGDLQERPSGDV